MSWIANGPNGNEPLLSSRSIALGGAIQVKLTPLDIRRQEFKRVVRGVDPEEVSVFLDMVAGEYERILREAKALEEERDELRRKVDEFDSMREAIHGAVVMAKKSADETVNQAKKEAELRLKEAEVESERMLEDTRRQASVLRRELDDIRNQRSILVDRLKSLLDGQMKMLEAYVGDWGQDERRREEADRYRGVADRSRAGADRYRAGADRYRAGSSVARRREEPRRFEAGPSYSSRTAWDEDAAAPPPSPEPTRPSAQTDRGPRAYEERELADQSVEEPEEAEAPDVTAPTSERDHPGAPVDESSGSQERPESSSPRRWIDHFRPGRHREARESGGSKSSGSERTSAGPETEGEAAEDRGADGSGDVEPPEGGSRGQWSRIRELTPRQIK